MRILLPTGAATYESVKKAAYGFDADVVVTGEIASFLTPAALRDLVQKGDYDMVIVSGMVTASFLPVEEETGIPVYLGPRHAADLAMVLSSLDTLPLSRSVPADDFIASVKRDEARRKLHELELDASYDYVIRGTRIGGSSRIKVLAEIMDAHRHEDVRGAVEQAFRSGADIVDLGFGFDATPDDVTRCFSLVTEVPGPLAIDTQDPVLIAAGLFRADIVLSLHDGNIPVIGKAVADAGIAAVIVPTGQLLEENVRLAEAAGISCIIADPLLQPVGSGLIRSLSAFPERCRYPVFFGAGNVVELLDADSPGMNALLAGMAKETGASVIFTSEHSDKTKGSVREMRTATEMVALAADRPYPKDLGIDLLILKEKRRRREPPLSFQSLEYANQPDRELQYDPKGNFRIGVEDDQIVAVINGRAVKGRSWEDIFATILKNGDVSLLDHAAYLGKELYKAELAIRFGRSFEQDGFF
ncbi:MAG: dihydropteroate synthase-like protein [Methanoregulaceae archaeon]|jgi:dihydropteroate synthase-like protein|nr:dihydropteroate synthase-like protein [Methanoregulaceae archaeon]